jgi:hypothetical protein
MTEADIVQVATPPENHEERMIRRLFKRIDIFSGQNKLHLLAREWFDGFGKKGFVRVSYSILWTAWIHSVIQRRPLCLAAHVGKFFFYLQQHNNHLKRPARILAGLPCLSLFVLEKEPQEEVDWLVIRQVIWALKFAECTGLETLVFLNWPNPHLLSLLFDELPVYGKRLVNVLYYYTIAPDFEKLVEFFRVVTSKPLFTQSDIIEAYNHFLLDFGTHTCALALVFALKDRSLDWVDFASSKVLVVDFSEDLGIYRPADLEKCGFTIIAWRS